MEVSSSKLVMNRNANHATNIKDCHSLVVAKQSLIVQSNAEKKISGSI